MRTAKNPNLKVQKQKKMKNLDKLKELREETGVSYSVCRDALDEAKGDMDKARKILTKKGAEVAKKKGGRETGQGRVFTYVHHNGKIAGVVILLCETDFVAKNESFQKLDNDIAMQIASADPQSSDALTSDPFIKDPDKTIGDLIKSLVLKLGENISIGDFKRFEV